MQAIGMQYKNLVSEKLTFIYNNFLGDEEVVSASPRFRSYHNFIFQLLMSDEWQYLWAFILVSSHNREMMGWMFGWQRPQPSSGR